MRANMHTHSVYCDGRDTPREMAKTAIEKGFDILGFSGHGGSPYDECGMKEDALKHYLEDVNALKEELKEKITIYTGIEEDMTCRITSKDPFDFVIGSVHFLNEGKDTQPIDASEEEFVKILQESFHGDFLAMAKQYYESVAKMKDYEEIDIIGHLDLLTKYNEDERYVKFDDPAYLAIAEDCIHALGNERIYEVNTGAIARGYRKTPYPSPSLLRILKEIDAKLMLNSDCHDRRYLDCAFDSSLELIKTIGFQELYILKDGAFIPVPIEQFH